MIATDLSKGIWNAIADLIARSASPREVWFVRVTKVDTKLMHIWAEEFGDTAIPLVSQTYGFSYYDTVPFGNAVSGSPIGTQLQKRVDTTGIDDKFQTYIICPSTGDTVVVIDPSGAKRFPFCIGVVQSKPGFWEDE